MTDLYKIDVRLIATMYIKAESEAEAAQKLAEFGDGFELFEEERGEFPITGRAFDDPRLPNISASPCMTLAGPCEGAVWELAEENVTLLTDENP